MGVPPRTNGDLRPPLASSVALTFSLLSDRFSMRRGDGGDDRLGAAPVPVADGDGVQILDESPPAPVPPDDRLLPPEKIGCLVYVSGAILKFLNLRYVISPLFF